MCYCDCSDHQIANLGCDGDCSEHQSANLIVCLSVGTCLVNTSMPSGVVVTARGAHARMQTQMRAHRLLGKEDQRGESGVDQGWIRVDQGGLRWLGVRAPGPLIIT